ncbi:MAG: diacylglycerol kinase family protein [Chloroflexi bacterium]|nr:diacylglycerol kinase family protein [Chloroflexota bacterium]
MKKFFVSRVASFRYAFQGWVHAFRTQHNMWVHATIASLVFLMALWLRLPARDWAVLVLTSAIVFSAEFINTAIEAIVDLASPEVHPLAKIGKDVGAAAVLVAALAAILVGLLILGPPLWVKLISLFQ